MLVLSFTRKKSKQLLFVRLVFRMDEYFEDFDCVVVKIFLSVVCEFVAFLRFLISLPIWCLTFVFECCFTGSILSRHNSHINQFRCCFDHAATKKCI